MGRRRRQKPKEYKAASDNSVLRAFLGSAALGLLLGLVPSALQIAGVVSMALAHGMMFLAWLIAAISIWLTESCKYTVAVRIISVVAVGVVIGSMDYWMVRKRAELDMANAPQGTLQLSKMEIPADHPLIEVGKRFGVNWYFTNPGPARIFNAISFHNAYVEEVDEDTNKKVRAAFEKDRAQYFTRKLQGNEIGLGERLWMTIPAPPLTQEQYEGILKGTTRIYFVAQIMWTNAQGHEALPLLRCVWLQGESYLAARRVEDLVWHNCL